MGNKDDQQKLAADRAARAAERQAQNDKKQADKDRRGVTPNESRPSKGMSGQSHGLHKPR